MTATCQCIWNSLCKVQKPCIPQGIVLCNFTPCSIENSQNTEKHLSVSTYITNHSPEHIQKSKLLNLKKLSYSVWEVSEGNKCKDEGTGDKNIYNCWLIFFIKGFHHRYSTRFTIDLDGVQTHKIFKITPIICRLSHNTIMFCILKRDSNLEKVKCILINVLVWVRFCCCCYSFSIEVVKCCSKGLTNDMSTWCWQ